MNYLDLADRVLDDGGFTVDLDGRARTSGYAVSDRPGAERIVHLPRTRRELAGLIEGYVVDHGRELRAGHLLGGWLDGRRVYLDLTMVTEDRAHALQVAELAGQLAIFDLSTGEEIRL